MLHLHRVAGDACGEVAAWHRRAMPWQYLLSSDQRPGQLPYYNLNSISLVFVQ